MISDRELFDGFPSKPYRNRALLDLAKGQKCVRCGMQHDETTVPAHFHGKWAHLFGKAGSQKCDDFLFADLCQKCHWLFDVGTLEDGDWTSEEDRELELLVCVARTWRMLISQGQLILAVNNKRKLREAYNESR